MHKTPYTHVNVVKGEVLNESMDERLAKPQPHDEVGGGCPEAEGEDLDVGHLSVLFLLPVPSGTV